MYAMASNDNNGIKSKLSWQLCHSGVLGWWRNGHFGGFWADLDASSKFDVGYARFIIVSHYGDGPVQLCFFRYGTNTIYIELGLGRSNSLYVKSYDQLCV